MARRDTNAAQKTEKIQVQKAVQKDSQQNAQTQRGKDRSQRRYRPLRTYWFQDDWIDGLELIDDGLIKP